MSSDLSVEFKWVHWVTHCTSVENTIPCCATASANWFISVAIRLVVHVAPTHAMSRRPVSAGNCGSEHFWLQTPPGVTVAHCGRSAQPRAHMETLICSTYLGAPGDGCVGHSGSAGSADTEATESIVDEPRSSGCA